jgi:hypothetical protein
MNKPYAWIIVPAVKTEDTDKLANLENLISELRDFGFNPAEDIEPKDRGNGEGDDDRDPIVPEDSIRRVIGEVVEEYNHNIERERIANSTFENKIKTKGEIINLDLDF